MPRTLASLRRTVVVLVLSAASAAAAPTPGRYLRLPVQEYRDRMKGGWIGQIAGVSFGAPTEFRFADRTIPEAEAPRWTPDKINQAFGQDDLYVEMTFLRTLEQYGLGVPIRQAGIDFANSEYALWCANNAGRTNLRRGIAPPDSSHPKYNRCPNDIDYQIEADFSGLIAPGLPNTSVALGEKFGRLMNYGDGMYAGQFIGALYAAAFFEKDLEKIVGRALEAIPARSQYAEMVRDIVAWHRESPADWEAAWRKAQEKYRVDPAYQKASNGGIDCKINGAYVLIGLLYGDGDLERTMSIACRCGQDSDCNPSSAAGVLATTIGFSHLPESFTSRLDETQKFSHTAYNVPGLIDVCEKLARQVVRRAGGRVVREDGQEVFLIPVQPARPSRLELSWAPGPTANARFSRAEMRRIRFSATPEHMRKAVAEFAPGWKIADCGTDMEPGLKSEALGRSGVLVTHPLDTQTPCVLTRSVAVPKGRRTALLLTVGHHELGDWDLLVRADGREVLRQTIGKETAPGGWVETSVDLTPFAGRTVRLELVNQPTGWAFEAGYWARIAIDSE